MVRSWLVGLDALVKVTSEDPDTSEYYIGGYAKSTFFVKRFGIVASLASYPSEGVICELMENDKLFLRAPFLKHVWAPREAC